MCGGSVNMQVDVVQIVVEILKGRHADALQANDHTFHFHDNTANPTAFGPYCGNKVLLFKITLVFASKLTVYPQGSRGAVFSVHAAFPSPVSPKAL